jgi:hypothetical protein
MATRTKDSLFGGAQRKERPQADKPEGKLLVRFIDLDPEVGKTYRYWVQVRVKNPNLDNKNVAALEMSQVEELVSGWTATPTVSIPGEVFFYAVDMQPPQKPVSHKISGELPQKLKGVDLTDKPSDVLAPVQLHRWTDRFLEAGLEHLIGDWVIAERILVRRGEPLERRLVVEIPEWDWRESKFVLATSTIRHRSDPFIPFDFAIEGRPVPLLVDFQGGGHDKYRTQRNGSSVGMKDHGALELLVLDESGKLVVRNSQQDTDDPVRVEHYKRWGDRVKAVRDQHDGGPARPGQGGGGPPGIGNQPRKN